jgi:selenocysteine lyase/cysteine desulfurase
MEIDALIADESARQRAFPVTAHRRFMGHAGVCPLPRVAVDAMADFCRRGSENAQENGWVWGEVEQTRASAARLLGCTAGEIALIGPTTLGLNLVAQGVPWETGDEVVYYPDDYPANVYPWSDLHHQGVKPVALEPPAHGVITWDVVEQALTPRTRLVSLASANFLSGYRVDLEAIGRELRERGVLFCVDCIQTLGAFPVSVEHIDFLSADSHKWLLGPCGAGIFYVRAGLQDSLRPALLGSWNVRSPEFVAQPDVAFEAGGRRYECGMLNLPGIVGMRAAMDLLMDLGVEAVGKRLLHLRRTLLELVRPKGYRLFIEDTDTRQDAHDGERSGIVTIHDPGKDMAERDEALRANDIIVSLRQNRAGERFLRFSPHFYNLEDDLHAASELL